MSATQIFEQLARGMGMEAEKPKSSGMSKNVLTAWGKALIKTGTEHLDLPMVRQGRQTLKEAEALPPTPPKAA